VAPQLGSETLTQLLHREITLNAPADGEADSSAFFRADDGDGVGFLRDPDASAVASCVDNSGFMERGRKQAAAAIRSFCTMTAPSCSGALGRKIVASKS
jgi:hypothetical protein